LSALILYKMNTAEAATASIRKIDFLFLAAGSDFRAYESLRKLEEANIEIGTVLLFKFTERTIANPLQYYSYESIRYQFKDVPCSIKDPSECVKTLMRFGVMLKDDMTVGIDISCFTKPYFYVILKYLRDRVHLSSLYAFYTEPKSYVFSSGLLKSYHSTSGPLSVMEIPGFPGEESRYSKYFLIVLLGFDGELSSFITDEISPEKTIVINGFPGYFPKFKDISLINNEKLVSSSDIKFARANNPFEVYNTLDSLHKTIADKAFFNIAPLGTKPMALGACLFAINNPSVRVIYPLPDQYEPVTTDQCWNCWCYELPLFL
jgi:hypothetical protein